MIHFSHTGFVSSIASSPLEYSAGQAAADLHLEDDVSAASLSAAGGALTHVRTHAERLRAA